MRPRRVCARCIGLRVQRASERERGLWPGPESRGFRDGAEPPIGCRACGDAGVEPVPRGFRPLECPECKGTGRSGTGGLTRWVETICPTCQGHRSVLERTWSSTVLAWLAWLVLLGFAIGAPIAAVSWFRAR